MERLSRDLLPYVLLIGFCSAQSQKAEDFYCTEGAFSTEESWATSTRKPPGDFK